MTTAQAINFGLNCFNLWRAAEKHDPEAMVRAAIQLYLIVLAL